jgi:4-methyl-5(b-hydroxyethyl)-thiazole monophosphate biosynthesis
MPAVADGNVITGQGPGAAIVFALAVLSHLAGDEAAEYISEGMVVS